jgi:hypothetical protein
MMGKFSDIEKKRQAAFKNTSEYFSEGSRVDGIFRNHSYSFILPTGYEGENLYSSIRQAAPNYFSEHSITQHIYSHHLCSSQISCLNFLFPFMNEPEALTALLRPLFPSIRRILPLETADQYVAFEWIGRENYLKERVSGKRRRGANCTSMDATVLFERLDGKRQIVLIEWKYTESYGRDNKRVAKSGTDRGEIYLRQFEQVGNPFNKTILPSYDALFYEPFYQFMRQQLLAHEVERVQIEADVASLLHIAPAHNVELQRVTSPELRPLGTTVTDIWKQLVQNPDRFASVTTEKLFGDFPINQYPQLKEWWDYINRRYVWLQN